MKVYHNPRCRKSREVLAILESKKCEVEIIEYLKNPLKVDELKQIVNLLNLNASLLQ